MDAICFKVAFGLLEVLLVTGDVALKSQFRDLEFSVFLQCGLVVCGAGLFELLLEIVDLQFQSEVVFVEFVDNLA